MAETVSQWNVTRKNERESRRARMSKLHLEQLEQEVGRLKDEEVRTRHIGRVSVSCRRIINHVCSTPEPFAASARCYESCYSNERITLLVLWCLKMTYPSLYQWLRRKIGEPILHLDQPPYRLPLLRKEDGDEGNILRRLFKREQKSIPWWKASSVKSQHTKEIDRLLEGDRNALGQQIQVLVCDEDRDIWR
jgi:hypothetical protein